MALLAVAVIRDSKNQKLLVQHRDKDVHNSPNKWGLFGGHVESGETPEVAVRRELEEEIGVRIDAGQFKLMRDYTGEDGNHRSVFLVELPMDTKIVLGEGQGYEWISYTDIFSYDLTDRTRSDMEFLLKK